MHVQISFKDIIYHFDTSANILDTWEQKHWKLSKYLKLQNKYCKLDRWWNVGKHQGCRIFVLQEQIQKYPEQANVICGEIYSWTNRTNKINYHKWDETSIKCLPGIGKIILRNVRNLIWLLWEMWFYYCEKYNFSIMKNII